MQAMRTTLAAPLKLLLGLWLALVMVSMFVLVPAHEGLGNLGRIIIVHVPTAWVTTLAFLIAAIDSALYLKRRRPADDERAVAAAELGLIFSILATATGSIFAKAVWGSFWNWDPRETSIFVLMLIYAAYFALRSAIDDEERRRRLGSVYALVAFVTVPFLIFVIPRIADSTLHPNCALLATSDCEGLELSADRPVGLLGDMKAQLLNVEQRDGLTVATVELTEPGAASKATYQPSFNTATGEPVARPEFTGSTFRLIIDRIDGEAIHINIEKPGDTGLLSNGTTLLTFFAALIGFTGLFFWLYRLRATLLGVQRRYEERGYGFA